MGLSIHIFGTVQPVHNDMKPVLGEGVPKMKGGVKKERVKINQIRLESGFFFILCFEKTFLKIT